MPGIRGHLLSAILIYPLYFLGYKLTCDVLKEPFMPAVDVLLLSYFVYIIGSDLPDVDSETAPIRWFAHALIPMLFLVTVFKSDFMDVFRKKFEDLAIAVLVFVSCVGGFIGGYLLKLLRHRGFLHTLSFALIYAMLAGFWSFLGVKLDFDSSLFIGFSGFFGVFTHLVLDYRSIKVLTKWW